MKITKETARRTLSLLDMFGTPERAAHEVRVSLTAIHPYSDRASEHTLAVLILLSAAADPTPCYAQLREIAGRQ